MADERLLLAELTNIRPIRNLDSSAAHVQTPRVGKLIHERGCIMSFGYP